MPSKDGVPITLVHSAGRDDPIRKATEQALETGRIEPSSVAADAAADDLLFSLRALEIEREVNRQELRNAEAKGARLRTRFNLVFGALPAIALLIDAALGRIEVANARVVACFGGEPIEGRLFLDLDFGEGARQRLTRALEKVRAQGQVVIPALDLRYPRGVTRKSRVQLDLLEPELGGRAQILVQIAELSDEPSAHDGEVSSWLALRMAAEGLERTMAFLIEDGPPGRFPYVTGTSAYFWGVTPAALAERPDLWRAGICEQDRPIWDLLADPASGVTQAEFRLTRPDGALLPVECRLFPTQMPGRRAGIVLDQSAHGAEALHCAQEDALALLALLAFLDVGHSGAAELMQGVCTRFAACFHPVTEAAVRITLDGADYRSGLWRDARDHRASPLFRDGQPVGWFSVQFSPQAGRVGQANWRSRSLPALHAGICTLIGRSLQRALDRV